MRLLRPQVPLDILVDMEKAEDTSQSDHLLGGASSTPAGLARPGSDVEPVASPSGPAAEVSANRQSTWASPSGQGSLRAWAARTFAAGANVLLPVAVTWAIVAFLDGLFSPIISRLFGVRVFGLGIASAVAVTFAVGLATSSMVGRWLWGVLDALLAAVPLVSTVYGSAKQIAAAVSPQGESGKAFRECVAFSHPRAGHLTLGFVTAEPVVAEAGGTPSRFAVVFVPTNHVYLGDLLLVPASAVRRTNLTVRQGLETVLSCGAVAPANLVLSAWAPTQPTTEPTRPTQPAPAPESV